MRITLFHPSSQKRGLESFLSNSQHTDAWNRKNSCVEIKSLQNSLNGQEFSFQIDAIDHFYRGSQHVLQRSNNHESISTATLQNQNIFTSLEHLALVVVCSSSQNKNL